MYAADALYRNHALRGNALPLVDRRAREPERFGERNNPASRLRSLENDGVFGVHSQSIDQLDGLRQEHLDLFSQAHVYTPPMNGHLLPVERSFALQRTNFA